MRSFRGGVALPQSVAAGAGLREMNGNVHGPDANDASRLPSIAVGQWGTGPRGRARRAGNPGAVGEVRAGAQNRRPGRSPIRRPVRMSRGPCRARSRRLVRCVAAVGAAAVVVAAVKNHCVPGPDPRRVRSARRVHWSPFPRGRTGNAPINAMQSILPGRMALEVLCHWPHHSMAQPGKYNTGTTRRTRSDPQAVAPRLPHSSRAPQPWRQPGPLSPGRRCGIPGRSSVRAAPPRPCAGAAAAGRTRAP